MSNLDFSHLSPQQLEEALATSSIPPPPGVVPNFVNPGNENTVALVGLIITLTLATAFLAIRIYVVFIKIRQPHLGDYLMPLGYAGFVVVSSGSFTRLSEVGLFVHQWDVLGRDIEPYLKVILIGDEFWILGICLIKSSILIEWHRLFAPSRARTAFTISCSALLTVNVLSYAGLLITLNLNCRPFERIWNKAIQGSCIDLRTIHLAAATVNLILNVATLLLPQRIIWKLQLSYPKKIGVSTVFTIGILATIASAFLIFAISGWRTSSDMTYHYSGVVLWAIAEMTCGILVFCAPIVPGFYQDLKLSTWLSGLLASSSSFANKVSWTSSSSSKLQSREERHPRSISRDYREIDESGSIRMHAYGSPRPTDRQYGIFVTTDIFVDTEQKNRAAGPGDSDEHFQYPWAAESSGVIGVRAEV
ncbi:hypothetical protein ANO14919_085660 [Xylariales sp. No.14919]|nr:hypothetical protein ANO14919_085660 [Xylariales sp. No.14919]